MVKKISFLLSSFLVVFSSCSVLNVESAYDTPPPAIPLHQAKGELKATAGYGHFLGLNGQVSYAITNHLALLGSGTFNHQVIKTYGPFNPIFFKLKSHSEEAGLGYYKVYKRPNPFNIIAILEMYGGLGAGLTDKKTNFDKNFKEDYFGTYGKYNKIFSQINLGIEIDRSYEFGFATRISAIHFNQLNYIEDNGKGDYRNITLLFAEPTFKFAMGKKNLKFIGQGGLAVPLTRNKSNSLNGNPYGNGSLILNAGIQYSFLRN